MNRQAGDWIVTPREHRGKAKEKRTVTQENFNPTLIKICIDKGTKMNTSMLGGQQILDHKYTKRLEE